MNNSYPIAILAGGLATRLRPLTEKIPKALIEINDEPFIFHQLRLIAKQNIQHVILCLGYLGEMVEERVGDGRNFNLEIKYVYDGDILLGTAGALKKALPLLGNDFYVMYGDSYLPCDFHAVRQTFVEKNKLALMTVYYNHNRYDRSNVEYSVGEIKVYDKVLTTTAMHYIDYGLGIFNSRAFADINANENFDLADLYKILLQKKELAAYEVKERFYEIGSLTGIKEFEDYLTNVNV